MGVCGRLYRLVLLPSLHLQTRHVWRLPCLELFPYRELCSFLHLHCNPLDRGRVLRSVPSVEAGLPAGTFGLATGAHLLSLIIAVTSTVTPLSGR